MIFCSTQKLNLKFFLLLLYYCFFGNSSLSLSFHHLKALLRLLFMMSTWWYGVIGCIKIAKSHNRYVWKHESEWVRRKMDRFHHIVIMCFIIEICAMHNDAYVQRSSFKRQMIKTKKKLKERHWSSDIDYASCIWKEWGILVSCLVALWYGRKSLAALNAKEELTCTWGGRKKIKQA